MRWQVLLGISCFISALQAQAFDEDSLFEKAFGRKLDVSYDKPLNSNLLFEDQKQSILVLIKKSDNTEVDVNVITKLLEPVLLPEYHSKLKSLKGFTSISKLNSIGIKLKFDYELFNVYLHVPTNMQRIRQLNINQRLINHESIPQIENAKYSGYVNIRSAESYTFATRQNIQRRSPLTSNFDGATNFNDYIFEANGSFTEQASTPWKIGDIRMVHDIPSKGIRITAGDLNYQTKNFQSFHSLGGITVASDFTMQGLTNTTPSGKHSFLINKISEVIVYVNEQQVYKKQLQPGRYDIRNFPFTSGANDVKIKVTDNVGKIEEYEFPFFYNYQLLEPGLQEFSYTLGLPSTNVNNRKRYNSKQATFSMFHRLGILNNLTVGINSQANTYQYNLALDSLWEIPIGTLQAELARSDIKNSNSGFATSIQYSKVFSLASMSAKFASHSEKFTTLGSLDPNNLDRYEMSARVSYPFVGKISTSLSSSWQLDRKFYPRSQANQLGLSKTLASGVQARTSLAHIKQVDKKSSIEFSLSVSYSVPNSRSSYNANYHSNDDSTTMEWDYSPITTLNSIGANVTVKDAPKSEDNLETNLTYNTNRFEGNLNYNMRSEHKKYNYYSQIAKLQLASAIGYVDGKFAIGRPISNSFVMVAANKHLSDVSIDVEPNGNNGFEAQTNKFGPALIGSMSAYQTRNISVDDSDFPVGQILENNTFNVMSKNHSATLIEVGTEATILLQGRLFDIHNKPIPRMTIALVPADNINKEVQEDELFFTGKRGFFAKQGVKPGKYLLVLYNLDETIIPIEVTTNADGIYDLGSVVLE